jgi:hypothetical protein
MPLIIQIVIIAAIAVGLTAFRRGMTAGLDRALPSERSANRTWLPVLIALLVMAGTALGIRAMLMGDYRAAVAWLIVPAFAVFLVFQRLTSR